MLYGKKINFFITTYYNWVSVSKMTLKKFTIRKCQPICGAYFKTEGLKELYKTRQRLSLSREWIVKAAILLHLHEMSRQGSSTRAKNLMSKGELLLSPYKVIIQNWKKIFFWGSKFSKNSKWKVCERDIWFLLFITL